MRMIFPVPVTLNLRFALFRVFIFGIRLSPRHTSTVVLRFRRFILGLIGIMGRLARAHRHNHRAALNMWCLFDDTDFAKLNCKPIEQVLADVLVRDFSPTEQDTQLNLVTILKEATSLPALRIEVVTVDFRTEANLFQFHRLLALARFALPTALLITELAVIHQATNWRHGGRLNLDEVKPPLTGHLHGVTRTYNTYVIAFFVNESNFGDPNPFVDTCRS